MAPSAPVPWDTENRLAKPLHQNDAKTDQTFILDSSLSCNSLLNSCTSCFKSESEDFQPNDFVNSVVPDEAEKVSSMTRLIKVEGRTYQRVDRKSAGGRTRVEVPVGRSLLDGHLLSGFGKRPGQGFRTGRDWG